MNAIATRSSLIALSVLPLLLGSACMPVPWGEGAVDLPPSSARITGGIERHVPEHALGDVAVALTTATTGAPIRLVGPSETSGVSFDKDIAISSFDLQTNESGLVLVAQIPQTTVTWWQAPAETTAGGLGCRGSLTLGPGAYRVGLDFATDKLGRITTLPADRAEWDGPFDNIPAADNGPECTDVQALDLASMLSRRVPTTIAAHDGGAIAHALGFALAAPLDGTTVLSRIQVRSHLRAREEQPVVFRDGGLSAYFELQTQAETAPCLAPWSFTPGRPSPITSSARAPVLASGGTGVFIPRVVLLDTLEALTIAGGLCGSFDKVVTPLSGAMVAELVPSWAEELKTGAVNEIVLEWQPHGPPKIAIDDEGELRMGFERIDIAVYGTWGGATWRIGGLGAALAMGVGFEVHRNGAVSAVVSDIALSDTTSDSGLLGAASAGELEALVADVARGLLDGRELMRLPAELAPATTTDVLVIPESDGLLVPTR